MIDHVILSMDSNPLYADFWELNCKLWWAMGVKPILIKIDNHNSIEDKGDKIIINCASVKGVDTGFQAQVSRLWATTLFPEKTLLTSDIDMLPLNKEYFFNNVKDFKDNQLISFFSNAYESGHRQPMCYLFAKGSVFIEILGDKLEYEDFITQLMKFCDGKERWTADEDFFEYKLIQWLENNKHRLVRIYREKDSNNAATNRIDRLFIDVNNVEKYVDNIDNYYDMHCPRPYCQYKKFIDPIFDVVMYNVN